jgi:hypothetical protein
MSEHEIMMKKLNNVLGKHAVSRAEAFGTGFWFSLGIMSGLFFSTLMAAAGVVMAWRTLGFRTPWPL